MDERWRQVTQLAARQHSLVSGADLDGLGAGSAERRTWTRQGRLIVVRRRVFRVCGGRNTWVSGALASVMAAGPCAVASHVTAAGLHGLGPVMSDGVGAPAVPSKPFHVIAPNRVRLDAVVVHRQDLGPRDRSIVDSVPSTSLERTLFDLAGMLDVTALGRCVDAAIRQGASLERIRQIADDHPGQGRSRRWGLRRVLAERLPDYDPGANPWERKWDTWWEESGLPRAERQYLVVVGAKRYVLDRAIPELRLGIEWNGFGYHGRRHKFDSDSFRRSDLLSIGWELIEVTSSWTPERVRRIVETVVERRLAEAEGFNPRSGTPSPAR